MKDLKERILEIVRKYQPNMYSETIASETEALIKENYYPKEFTKWLNGGTCPYYAVQDYWMCNINNIKYTLDEVHQYWLENIKDK